MSIPGIMSYCNDIREGKKSHAWSMGSQCQGHVGDVWQ